MGSAGWKYVFAVEVPKERMWGRHHPNHQASIFNVLLNLLDIIKIYILEYCHNWLGHVQLSKSCLYKYTLLYECTKQQGHVFVHSQMSWALKQWRGFPQLTPSKVGGMWLSWHLLVLHPRSAKGTPNSPPWDLWANIKFIASSLLAT